MARPRLRVLGGGTDRALGLAVLLALFASHAAAVTVTDPEGDPARIVFGEPVEAPAIDILEVEGTLENGTLRMRIEVATSLPIDAPEPDADRRYTYLFIIAEGEGEGSLYEEATLTTNCQFHHGEGPIQCEVSQGDGSIRRVGTDDRNVTAHLNVPWDGPFRIGAAAHESFPNGTQRDIVAQDFTDNALPYQEPPGDGDPPPGPPESTPWWRTPWILLVVLLILVLGGWAWAQRPGGEERVKERTAQRRARRREDQRRKRH